MKSKINWLEWDKESFEKAKKEDKLILLDLTAVWCHWCHVMDSTSYSDDEIVKIINQEFIPVKVYIDKRPDIRDRYNMGGFPSTIFLNPEGHILSGETYVPPERFKFVLEAVKKAYKDNKDNIEKSIRGTIKDAEKEISKAKISESIIKDVLLSVEDNFDSNYGGFGTQPKFPAPEVVDLLFLQYHKTRDKKYLDMTLKTLDGIYEGLFDKVDFGFFRYSVTQNWKLPHYEKMLDTNAGLLRNYAVAFKSTKNEKYKKIMIGILDYVNKFLSDQNNGGFYGSQDADEEFYHLKPEEKKDKDQPYIDKTIYVDWNAMMISSYIKAGAILNDEKVIGFALKTVDFILDKCYVDKKGLFHFFDGKSNINGLLADNIHFLNCLIDVYFITQDQKYFDKIKDIAEYVLINFYDSKNYGFFDRILKEGDLGILKQRNKQFLENSFSAIVFLRLYFLTEDGRYREYAENTLLYFYDSYVNSSYFAAMYAIAADMFFGNRIKVDIFERKDMINMCIGAGNNRIVVNFVDKNKPNAIYAVEGAYICKGTVCKGPIKDNNKLEEELTN